MNLLTHNDKDKYLVIERGACDLDTFVKLRRKKNDPLSAEEIFIIAKYVAESMLKLHKIGISLCDIKEKNILLR